MEPGDVLDLGDLPAYVHEQDGLPRLYPCAGAYFGERVMEAVLGRGVMPLVSWRDRNAVRLARFQSIADPVRALAGPWR
jgi:type VI secretion system protein ImpC